MGPDSENTHSTDWAIVAAWEIKITNWKVSLCSHFDRVFWALRAVVTDLWMYLLFWLCNYPVTTDKVLSLTCTPVSEQVILIKRSAAVCLSVCHNSYWSYSSPFFQFLSPFFARATSCHSPASPCSRRLFLAVVAFRIFSNSPNVGASLCGLHTSSSVAASLVVLTLLVRSAVLRRIVPLNTDCVVRNVCVLCF